MGEPGRSGPRDVVIAGAGSAGELLFDCLDGDDAWNVIAFLDEGKGGSMLFDRPVLHPDSYDPRRCRTALVAAGSPAVRRALVDGAARLDLSWATYVDRRSHVSRTARLGEGTIVFPFASVAPGTVLGRFSYLGGYASVGKRSVLGEFATLAPRSSAGACLMGDDCVVGFNSACLDGAQLGDGVVLAPYTWVRKPVPAGSFVAGTPPRVTRRRDRP